VRGVATDGAVGGERLVFDLNLTDPSDAADDDADAGDPRRRRGGGGGAVECLRCFSASYSAARALDSSGTDSPPLVGSFTVSIEQGSEGRLHVLKVLGGGRYVLCRSSVRRASSAALSMGASLFGAPRDDKAERLEELCACLLTEPIGGVHTLELIVPHGAAGRADGAVVPLQNLAAASNAPHEGLLPRYERGDVAGLLVFVGRIQPMGSGNGGGGCVCKLSLPKTQSKNLALSVGPAESHVAYKPPIAPIQAFTAALALRHFWAVRGARRLHAAGIA
jgi:hypothetical protein